MEVIVVENGSDGDLRPLLKPYLKKFSRFTHIYLNQVGANLARNAGLARATGQWIYFIDDDCQIPEAWSLHSFRELSRRNPNVSGFGGYYQACLRAPFSARYYNSMCNLWLRSFQEASGRSLRLLGGNSIYRASLFSGDCKFRQEIVYGGSESELQARMVERGATFLLSDQLNIIHSPDFGWWAIFQRAWAQSANRARYPEIRKKRSSLSLESKSMRAMDLIWLLALVPYFVVGKISFYSTKALVFLGSPRGARTSCLEDRAG
mgnify:CR=1 FL=1